jgi:Uma2 family endonuclease
MICFLLGGDQSRDSMMAEPQLRRMSQDEFFAWQERQDQLYELVDGMPVLPLKIMTGASQAHDRVVVNIPCRPTTDDLAVRIPAGNVRRPDVTVECGEAGRRELAVREPRVVIEVLSPSTMTFDRIRRAVARQGGRLGANPARRPRRADRACSDQFLTRAC